MEYLVGFALFLLVAIAVAWYTYYLYERPVQRAAWVLALVIALAVLIVVMGWNEVENASTLLHKRLLLVGGAFVLIALFVANTLAALRLVAPARIVLPKAILGASFFGLVIGTHDWTAGLQLSSPGLAIAALALLLNAGKWGSSKASASQPRSGVAAQ